VTILRGLKIYIGYRNYPITNMVRVS